MTLEGFGFAGYRSFPADVIQRIGPLSKVNLLAGPNNSGKSNILGIAQEALPAMKSGSALALADQDRPLGDGDQSILRVAILKDGVENHLVGNVGGRSASEVLREVLRGETFEGPGEAIWFEFELTADGRWRPSGQQIHALSNDAGVADRGLVAELSGSLTSARGSFEENAARVLAHVATALKTLEDLPNVKTIGAFRQIRKLPELNSDDFDGPGLILRLAQLQNPTFAEGENRKRFDAITRFVQTLFDDPEATIDVPHDRETIIIRHQGQRLPLENYGTGIHEVVILAVAATVLKDTLLCIEEPEIHLHPALQRKFLRYLVNETDNQYLIATHSAHLLDAAIGSISRVRLENGITNVSAAIEPQEVAEIGADLGVRASDLVQANSVIWVEGPSDRIYLRHWLSLISPEFVEGIHYSIMFYGGTLLSHLTASDTAVEEFIRLPRINRNFGIVIDSDRKSRHAHLNATKKRVRKEIEVQTGFKPWVTQGYTIENYVPVELFKEALKVAHPNAKCRWNGDQYQNPVSRSRIPNRASAVNKAAIATEVVSRWDATTPWPLNLRRRVKETARLIEAANADGSD